VVHRQKKRYMVRSQQSPPRVMPLAICLASLALGACVTQNPITEDLVEESSQGRPRDDALPTDMSKPEEATQTPTTLIAPRVKGDRLWTRFFLPLVGQRYWTSERAATRQQITQTLTELGWRVEEQGFEQGVNLVVTYSQADLAAEVTPQILVGAHYDTVQGSPGADDNATGVATLLELAALYDEQAKLGLGPQRALTLVFFDQEEQGLLGSLAFTAEPNNLDLVHGAVVLDMLGASCDEPGCQQYPQFLEQLVAGGQLSDRGDFIAIVGEAERPDLLGAFGGRNIAAGAPGADPLPNVLSVPVPFKGLLTPDVLRSDHAAFWLNGIGAVLVTDTANLRNPHYHQPSDRVEQVDRVFFEGVAQQVVNGVWRLLAETES